MRTQSRVPLPGRHPFPYYRQFFSLAEIKQALRATLDVLPRMGKLKRVLDEGANATAEDVDPETKTPGQVLIQAWARMRGQKATTRGRILLQTVAHRSKSHDRDYWSSTRFSRKNRVA